MIKNFDFTGISVACKTPELIQVAYLSFRKFYTAPLIIVNGLAADDDMTTRLLRHYERRDPRLTVIYRPDNVGHGPGMNLALRACKTPVAYVFDSDTRMDIPPVGAMMEAAARVPAWYAVGSVGAVDDKGYAGKPESYIPYVHPAIMLVNVLAFRAGAGFIDHGAPVISAMKELHAAGRSGELVHFPVRDYVFHGWRGTRMVTRRFL